MSPQAVTWASSLPSVVDNLLHAAVMDVAGAGGRRSFTLPTACFTMQALVAAIAQVHGADVAARVRYQPDPDIEQRFGRFPQLRPTAALAAGFRADDSLVALVRRALEGAGDRCDG
jgi:hypothetical protein